MTKKDIGALLFAVLGALYDAKRSVIAGIPNGYLYAELMDRFDNDVYVWSAFVEMMKTNGLATETNYLLTITPKGEEFFRKMADAVLKRKGA